MTGGDTSQSGSSKPFQEGGVHLIDLGTEGLGDWLAPHALGRTLFTSRTRRFTHVPTLDLPQLDPDEARSLLTRQSALTADDAALADKICAALGFHALAVDVTAALVERRGLAGTLKALERADQDVLDLAAQFEEALPNGHQRHIAATFLASIGQLDEHARKLLRLAAVLAAAPIPRRLLVRCVGAAASLEDDDAQDDTDLAIDRLLSASLADDAGGGAINVHTLVSRTMRFADGSPKALATWREHAVGALTEEMAQATDIRRHAHLEQWVEHARELSGANGDLATVELLGRVARYDYERAAYALARRGFEQQRDVRKRLLGEAHPDTLTSMNDLAMTLLSQGDLPSARRLQEAALEIRQRVQGKAHPDTLTSMNNLAVTLADQGDLLGAGRLQKAVLQLRRRVQGEEDPDTLTSMNNLACTLWDQGDLPGARRLQEAVLERRRRVQGETHPDTLMSMNNLAIMLADQGDLPGARRLQEAVLEVMKRVQGEAHPDTLMSMNNLAMTLSSQGDLPGARRLEEAVLKVMRRVLGETHQNTLTAMNNLAVTLWQLGESDTARQLQHRCVAGRTLVLGATHSQTRDAAETLMQMGSDAGSDDRDAPA